jgi:hypothetical protein
VVIVVFLKVLHVLALLLFLASSLPISLRPSWCVDISLIFACGHCSSSLQDSNSTGTVIFSSILQILSNVQLFVLGPRLILSVREYHTKLVADSDAATGMTSIAFQERVHVSTSSTV